MTLPEILETALNDAKKALDSDMQNRLHLPFRQRIWHAMGPNLRDQKDIPFGVGLKRRTKLAILCAEKVMPIWFNKYPDDDDPVLIISTAEQVIEKQVDYDSGSKILDSFYVKTMNLRQEDARPTLVGFCVSGALSTALVDCTDSEQIDDNQTDFDNDPETWECSVFASMAYANDQPEIGLYEADKMYEFWKWYIDEAVPQAYEAYSDE